MRRLGRHRGWKSSGVRQGSWILGLALATAMSCGVTSATAVVPKDGRYQQSNGYNSTVAFEVRDSRVRSLSVFNLLAGRPSGCLGIVVLDRLRLPARRFLVRRVIRTTLERKRFAMRLGGRAVNRTLIAGAIVFRSTSGKPCKLTIRYRARLRPSSSERAKGSGGTPLDGSASGYRACARVRDIGPTGRDPADGVRIRALLTSCRTARRVVKASTGAFVRDRGDVVRVLRRWRCTNTYPAVRCAARGGKRIRFRNDG